MMHIGGSTLGALPNSSWIEEVVEGGAGSCFGGAT